MVRTPLTSAERERGLALGRALQQARGDRSAAEVAQAARISLDTLRKIERGAIAAPTFFTVAALARVLGLDLTDLAELTEREAADAAQVPQDTPAISQAPKRAARSQLSADQGRPACFG